MKKIRIRAVAFLLLLSVLLGTNVFAGKFSVAVEDLLNETVSFSEDFKTLYVGKDHSYSRFDASDLDLQFYTYDMKVALSETQKQSVKSVQIEIHESERILRAHLVYRDGSTVIVSFLRDDCFEFYLSYLEGTNPLFCIDFRYPSENVVEAKRDQLLGEKKILNSAFLSTCEQFPVYACNEDGSLRFRSGVLLIGDNVSQGSYFVDLRGKDLSEGFYPQLFENLEAYRITDEALLAELEEAQRAYYDEDFGFFFDDEFTSLVSNVSLILMFGLIPLAILIVFFIAMLRSKVKAYRKIYTAIALISVSELIVFAVVSVIMSILS
ncbi:MAG: hypothetical protein IKD31_03950 [Clostridia bacterium]|nr:hypothetical protein [Clostridia bacterium]